LGVIGFNKFPLLALEFHNATAPIVAETAQFIAETYAANAPRRSGFMAESAYYRTVDTSTYGSGVAPPTDDVYLLPEVDGPSSDQEAYAGVAADYAGFVELGTRHMGAQPTFYPAVDLAIGYMEAQGHTLEQRLTELI
jgi:hypothetical protein